MNKSFWEVGRVLHEVYSSRIYTSWGYDSYSAYCEGELNLKLRTAQSLQATYRHFVIDLKVSKMTLDQLTSIGSAKAYLIRGVATKENLAFWLNKAQTLGFAGLKAEIENCCNGGDPKPRRKRVGTRRNQRDDLLVCIMTLFEMESVIRLSGKRLSTNQKTIMEYYQRFTNVKTKMKLVA